MKQHIKNTLGILVSTIVFTTLGVCESSDHGKSLHLGSVNVLDVDYSITQFGKLSPGKEGAFEVTTSKENSNSSVYLWAESEDGQKISAPSKGHIEKGKLHFHLLPNENTTPYRIVLRVREGDKDARGSLPLIANDAKAGDEQEKDHGHDHGHDDDHGHGHDH